jgi:hypothetical protein
MSTFWRPPRFSDYEGVGEGGKMSEYVPIPVEAAKDLLALVHKWRASGNGHIRRGRGYTTKDREHAVKALAQGGIYRLCASELESTLIVRLSKVNILSFQKSFEKDEKNVD